MPRLIANGAFVDPFALTLDCGRIDQGDTNFLHPNLPVCKGQGCDQEGSVP
jgi:hypothetical protein